MATQKIYFPTKQEAVNIIALTDGTETMAQLATRLATLATSGITAYFDTSAITTTPQSKLVSALIDTTAGKIRFDDKLTGRIYIGPYDATMTLATVLSRMVDTYVYITVTATTLDGVTVTGQTVTLREGSDASAPIYETAAYNGAPVSFMVPKGFRYFVSISSTLPAHFSPTTASGTANAPVSATLTYSDVSNITTFTALRGFLDSVADDTTLTTDDERVAFAESALISTASSAVEIPDTWTAANGDQYDNPMVVAGVGYFNDENGNRRLGALMQRKWATYNDTQFDESEDAVLCDSTTETTAAAGMGYYGWAPVYDSTKAYAVNNYCSYNGAAYKCTTAIAAGGETWNPDHWTAQTSVVKSALVLLTPYLDWNAAYTYAANANVEYNGAAYNCSNAVETPGTPPSEDAAHWSLITSPTGLVAGGTLPYSSYLSIHKNGVKDSTKNIFSYGYNNWKDSAFRQYLNSSAAAGAWWTATHTGDSQPNNLNSVRGYLAGCSSALLAALEKAKIKTWANNITDGPNNISTVYETADKIFLPSGIEVFGDVNRNGVYAVEGIYSKYWQLRTGYTNPSNTATDERKIYRELKVGSTATRSAVSVHLRSPSRGSSSHVWFVHTAGQVANYSANNAYAALPACIIMQST